MQLNLEAIDALRRFGCSDCFIMAFQDTLRRKDALGLVTDTEIINLFRQIQCELGCVECGQAGQKYRRKVVLSILASLRSERAEPSQPSRSLVAQLCEWDSPDGPALVLARVQRAIERETSVEHDRTLARVQGASAREASRGCEC